MPLRFATVSEIAGGKMLRKFIEKVGRDALMNACRVTIATTYNWERQGRIPKKYRPLIETVARDSGAFTLWKALVAGWKK